MAQKFFFQDNLQFEFLHDSKRVKLKIRKIKLPKTLKCKAFRTFASIF